MPSRAFLIFRPRLLGLLFSGLGLLAVLGLSGCDAFDGGEVSSPYSDPYATGQEFSGKEFAGEAMVRQADLAGAARAPEAGGEADASRIEERRHYQLQFDAADALVAAYHEAHEACLGMGGCQVEQGRLSTPRQGLAGGTLVMRIARDRVDEAEPVQRLGDSPALSGVEITREDRTQQMIDLEARLAQQVVLRERLAELAQEGRGFSERRIQDLLQVERELARVQGEIESMQGRQRHLSRVTASVSVTASFQQQRWVEPHQHGPLAPLWRALDRSVSLFFESVGQVILVVVFLTPWLVLGIPALWLLTRLWRPVRRGISRLGQRRRARRAAPSDDV
ncbi:DUF4349 domain-containing protein [Halomonas sp. PGE1]|uniref:DUF4349 domain-containing protein n=1 Tax=Halomonas sp. PGE1 TaxID=2730360 RepID=UPI001474EAAD|nr:DUF4349 domain-containing protein [Halomonas sp. PGE1]QJQ97663.1 DUF4349 domain-containing protein [Halomonas sp. PGE1]